MDLRKKIEKGGGECWWEGNTGTGLVICNQMKSLGFEGWWTLQHIQPVGASHRSPSSLRRLLGYAWKMCRLSCVKMMHKSLNFAWKLNIGYDGAAWERAEQGGEHPGAPVSSFGTSRVPAVANGNWWFGCCRGSCDSDLRCPVSRCPSVGPSHASKWSVSRCPWGGIIGNWHASISCEIKTNWKVRGWIYFMLTYIMWTPRLQLNDLFSSQWKSTDLVGQLYLNSDWVESFPSEPGLVYPGNKRTPQKIVQSIISYFGSKYVNLGRAKTSHVV